MSGRRSKGNDRAPACKSFEAGDASGRMDEDVRSREQFIHQSREPEDLDARVGSKLAFEGLALALASSRQADDSNIRMIERDLGCTLEITDSPSSAGDDDDTSRRWKRQHPARIGAVQWCQELGSDEWRDNARASTTGNALNG